MNASSRNPVPKYYGTTSNGNSSVVGSGSTNSSNSSNSANRKRFQYVQKTKFALSFLCLFDGLRTPSIRRLVRKPRLICDRPLLTFDPSFYAPSSKNDLTEIYRNSGLACPSEIVVDPSVQTVLTLLRRHTSSMPPQRVVFHYCGYGVLQPNADGCIFFFTDDRQRYKPLKIQNVINACSCPLALIIDCTNAGVLKQHINFSPNSNNAPVALSGINTNNNINNSISNLNRQFSNNGMNNNITTNTSNNNYNFSNSNSNNIKNSNNNNNGIGNGINSSILAPNLTQKNANNSNKDLFAFFSCAEGESLPLSTEAPMDLFSSCLLKPFETALQWYMRQNSSLFIVESSEIDQRIIKNSAKHDFLLPFFNAILDSIIFETQFCLDEPPNVTLANGGGDSHFISNELYFRSMIDIPFLKVTSINALTRGFALAQKIMLSFNLHPQSVPDLKPMALSQLWEFWELVLDSSVTMNNEEVAKMIFKLFITSFKKFPRCGLFPLFAYWINSNNNISTKSTTNSSSALNNNNNNKMNKDNEENKENSDGNIDNESNKRRKSKSSIKNNIFNDDDDDDDDDDEYDSSSKSVHSFAYNDNNSGKYKSDVLNDFDYIFDNDKNSNNNIENNSDWKNMSISNIYDVFHIESCRQLLIYLDRIPGACNMAARSSIAQTIVSLSKPSGTSLLVLSKILSTCEIFPFIDQQTPFNFLHLPTSSNNSNSKTSISDEIINNNSNNMEENKPVLSYRKIESLKYGMLAVSCALKMQTLASFNRLVQACIEYAEECAPYSCITLGLLLEKAGKLLSPPSFVAKFVEILGKNKRSDVRTAIVYLLGNVKDINYFQQDSKSTSLNAVLEMILQLVDDNFCLVRQQCLLSIISLVKNFGNLISTEEMKNIYVRIKKLETDKSNAVSDAFIDNEIQINMIFQHVKVDLKEEQKQIYSNHNQQNQQMQQPIQQQMQQQQQQQQHKKQEVGGRDPFAVPQMSDLNKSNFSAFNGSSQNGGSAPQHQQQGTQQNPILDILVSCVATEGFVASKEKNIFWKFSNL